MFCSYHAGEFILRALTSNLGKLGQLLSHSVPITAIGPAIPLSLILFHWKGAVVKTETLCPFQYSHPLAETHLQLDMFPHLAPGPRILCPGESGWTWQWSESCSASRMQTAEPVQFCKLCSFSENKA